MLILLASFCVFDPGSLNHHANFTLEEALMSDLVDLIIMVARICYVFRT
jgi:hypothetical protein